MFKKRDVEYLIPQLSHNRCVLFVGAGFSEEAINALDEPIPAGRDLARQFWDWLAYEEEFDPNTNLGELFQAALNSKRPLADLKYFLEARLLAESVPAWYQTVARVFWHRVYSTNVDNVIETAYRESKSTTRLKTLAAPVRDYAERDQFLASIQYVKLNGSLPGDPRDLTFTPRQYARRTTQHDTWYDHFVRDYTFHPVIFLGTQLEEPLFWQAIEARERRGDNPEERPRSFLITPEISPPKRAILKALNIVHVEGTARDFLDWLASNYSFPERLEVIRLVRPEDAASLDGQMELPIGERDSLLRFLEAFPRVPLVKVEGHHKMFFLGTTPTWHDIASDFDAPREITADLLQIVGSAWGKSNSKLAVIGVLGEGGAGKSTILRRVAFSLRAEGKDVFFSDGGDRPDKHHVTVALRNLPQRSILFIDNASLFGKFLGQLLEALFKLKNPPVVVFAARYNLAERYISDVALAASQIIKVPNLSDKDIDAILSTLERHRQLGRLEGMGPGDRRKEFSDRAQKQILVAMREATQGQGFDEILKSEYNDVQLPEARVLFLAAALGTAELVDISRGQFLGCAEVPPAEAVAILRRNLKGMLVEQFDGKRIAARHQLIAEHIIDIVAEREDLLHAYERLLAALAHDIYGGTGRHGRAWRLFVRLINHASIYERFTKKLAMARQIYESIGPWFQKDGHYWLQYANLEIEYGELPLARNHLAHAESIMPHVPFVWTSKAHLDLKAALAATSREEALRLQTTAEVILFEQMQESGDHDEYPYHVYLTQMLNWVRQWCSDPTERVQYLEVMYRIGEEARDRHPTSPRIKQVSHIVEIEYLRTASTV